MLHIADGDKKELRKFSIILFIALGILGGVGFFRKGELGIWLWAIGVGVLLLGLLRPRVLALPYKIWMTLSWVLGFLTSHIILALMYYLVFTPVGLMRRIFSGDPVARGFDRNAPSYWIKREQGDYGKERYEKMY